ncbi:DUF6647 family protein [Eionea flava]
MEQLLVVLLLWISQHSAFTYHPDMGLPVVEHVTQRQLAHIYIGDDEGAKKEGTINTQGFLSEADYQSLAVGLEAVYAADKNTIYLGEKVDLNTDYGRSVLVHELIHFLQKTHQHHTQVACGNALEKDAYTIQADFMKAHDLVPPFTGFTVMMRSLCEEDLV